MKHLAAAAFALLAATPAVAQDKYPSRPLTIIIPFGAGSSSDVGVRLMAGKMQPRFGQPILVEAKPGLQGRPDPLVKLDQRAERAQQDRQDLQVKLDLPERRALLAR